MKIFISYTHHHKEKPPVDILHFKAGQSVIGQMDELQDSADCQLLCLSNAYLKSQYCQHEMQGAIDKDPEFKTKTVIPVLLEQVNLPQSISTANPLYVKLFGNDSELTHQWDVLCRTLQIEEVEGVLVKANILNKGDIITIVASSPLSIKGKTNFLKLHKIGEKQ